MCKLPPEQWDYYLEWLFDYEYEKLGLPKPDKVIYLQVPIDISQSLLSKRYAGNEGRKDIHESNIKFLQDCKNAAEYVAKQYDWEIVSCSENGKILSIEEIHKKILSAVKKDTAK